jgi:hypothetical protein
LWRVFWDTVSRTIFPSWFWTTILLTSASWVAGITGVSCQYWASICFLVVYPKEYSIRSRQCILLSMLGEVTDMTLSSNWCIMFIILFFLTGYVVCFVPHTCKWVLKSPTIPPELLSLLSVCFIYFGAMTWITRL